MPIEIQWIASMSSSCLHAAEAVVFGRMLAERRLNDAFIQAAMALGDDIRAAGFKERIFWRHLTAVAHQVENNRELASHAIRKTLGRTGHTDSLAAQLAGRISTLESSYTRAIPGVVDELTHRSRPLREQWEAYGPGILKGTARLTDERLIVQRAEVILVDPALGGGGAAHLANNSLRIEAVLTNNVPALPEVVRLAWLIAQLNHDMPVFGELVPAARLPLLASLAMLPPVIAAAEALELTAWNPTTVQTAVTAWLGESPPPATTETLELWWSTYQASRPAWSVALQALDRMLQDSPDSGSQISNK